MNELQLSDYLNISEPTFVFSYTHTHSLAKDLIDSQKWKRHFIEGKICWKRFEDGFPNLTIENVHEIRGKNVVFLADFLNSAEMFEQLGVIYELPRYLAKSLTVVLAYFPTGTMERIEKEGQIATAMTMARILNATPLTQRGPTKVVIYDIHALQNRFYFSDNLIPVLCSAIPIFLNELKNNLKEDNIAIAFPDEGSFKRFANFFTNYECIICLKKREHNRRIVTMKEGDPKSKHVFIVDDLVKTGGTLIECKNALLEHGATQVSAFVTHAVFPEQSWKKFLSSSSQSQSQSPSSFQNFSHFYITDSCSSVSKLLENQPPFKVLSIVDSLAETLLNCRL
eukprot:TRINITY_DN5098_c0_g1_i1.p1 TRINITY_DN5098_c0_g1~~TRINITY_DN5098_c0_g1_i1.p1  ORF type:complete len:339 (-),score=96.65 TRINITY_DN5098_c0_g1_i1:170-1186(-)